MAQPTSDHRRYLVIAGVRSHDALDVMNAFYNTDCKCDGDGVASEYWRIKIAILCDRIVRAEKSLGAVREELAYRHMAESQVLRAKKLTGILMEIATGPAAMNPENQDDVNAVAEASRLLETFARAFEVTAKECQDADEHHWEADLENDDAVCKVCGKRDSLDVL